jgi:hypothetical protein
MTESDNPRRRLTILYWFRTLLKGHCSSSRRRHRTPFLHRCPVLDLSSIHTRSLCVLGCRPSRPSAGSPKCCGHTSHRRQSSTPLPRDALTLLACRTPWRARSHRHEAARLDLFPTTVETHSSGLPVSLITPQQAATRHSRGSGCSMTRRNGPASAGCGWRRPQRPGCRDPVRAHEALQPV